MAIFEPAKTSAESRERYGAHIPASIGYLRGTRTSTMLRSPSLTLWLTLILGAAILGGLPAEEPPTYRVQRASGPIQVNGKEDEAAWKNARSVGPFQFPWWQQ